MSQEKVDKRKYEKKHRAEIMKKKRRHKIIGWSIFGVVLGGIVGSIAGVKIYNAIPKYVEPEKLSAYVSQVWAENGYSDYFSDTASDTDAEEEEEG